MRVRVITLLLLLLFLSTSAQAGIQLYEGSWTVKSFGNHVTDGQSWPETAFSHWGLPNGQQCNGNQPICPISQTPTGPKWRNGHLYNGFHPLGPFCANLSTYGGGARPSKFGGTVTRTVMTNMGGTVNGIRLAPRYRNPAFFTSGGQPNHETCTATTVAGQEGRPITGLGVAYTRKGPYLNTIDIYRADTTIALITTTDYGYRYYDYRHIPGLAGQRKGSFAGTYPYIYSYTYANLENEGGTLGRYWGPGDFFGQYGGRDTPMGGMLSPLATVKIQKGVNQFGGTMRMLGKISNRVCFFNGFAGQCAMGGIDWRYDEIGAWGKRKSGMLTKASTVVEATLYSLSRFGWSTYNPYPVTLKGYRFPWTTGQVTVAAPTGSHNTFQKGTGYDNRTPDGEGTIQFVSPVLTHWLNDAEGDTFTGGVAFLKIKFLPEPMSGLALASGAAMLFVLARRKVDK